MKEQEKKIIEIIDQVRPYLKNDGGDVSFIKYENDVVYVKLLGACSNCHMLDTTLKDGLEAIIKEEVPTVVEVINIP